MYPPHGTSPDDPGNHHSGPNIPLPRNAPDNDIENLPETGSDQPIWRYDQKRTRGDDRHFTGHVTRVGGAEGQRLRGDLADVIGDLLRWARTQQRGENRTEPDDDDSQTDAA